MANICCGARTGERPAAAVRALEAVHLHVLVEIHAGHRGVVRLQARRGHLANGVAADYSCTSLAV